MATELERLDIQGIVFSGYGHLECSAYQLLRVTDAKAAREWLGWLAGSITDARGKKETFCRNVAFTVNGLKALGLDDESLTTFAWPFRDGMTSEHRQRILGDTDVNVPGNWQWGNDTTPVHIVLMIFAANVDLLNGEIAQNKEKMLQGIGVELVKTLGGGRHEGTREHFGFNDGIANPSIEGTSRDRSDEMKPG